LSASAIASRPGTTFLLLNLDNMIERDYQFTEETPGGGDLR
jgi:hypothetical protein